MRARSFFYVCAGIFLLALSYHLGARNAGAQAPANPVVAVATVSGAGVAVTANGDAYLSAGSSFASWTFKGNVFSSSPTPATQETWGSVKARYR